MSEFTYKDYIPANARVLVSYGKNQKVRFSYPRKTTYSKAIWKQGYASIVQYWIFFNCQIIFYFAFISVVAALVWGIWAYFPFNFLFEPTQSQGLGFDWFSWLCGFFIMLYVFGLPAIFTYFYSKDRERFSSLIPVLNYKTHKLIGATKRCRFKKKDLSENKAVIPVFKNIFLHYSAKQDFGRFLKKVEILELPFDYETSMAVFGLNSKKRKRNDTLFRAVFYFSQTPEKGCLDVEFW